MTRIMLLSLLLLTFCFCGCQPSKKPAPDETFMTESQVKEAELLHAIERRYENPEAHYQLGNLYQSQGLWKKAQFHYNVARGYDPIHYRAAAGQVKVTILDGNPDKAAILADTFITQVNYKAPASMFLGRAFELQMLDDYALICYQQALKIEPENPLIAKKIAYFHLKRGEKQVARQYFERSFRFDWNQPDVSNELGKLGIIVEVSNQEVDILEEE